MTFINYVGNPLQTRGAEQIRLQGGKGDGMRFLIVRNGLGLEAWISLDRCADLMRVTFKGENMGYMSPCGNVAPQYYDDKADGFLKSFTAGFFTTAGLTAVGAPCTDNGETLPLHGNIANTPAELLLVEQDNEKLSVKVSVNDSKVFAHKYELIRKYDFSYTDNKITVSDRVFNNGDGNSPFMILYHCNMGYPLLNENSVVCIPNNGVIPRNVRAKSQQENALKMEKPQPGYEECCYYYDVKAEKSIAKVGIYSPKIDMATVISYNKEQLPCFTQWKMMGKHDYVLGLEPGNCTPDGRDVMRQRGMLQFIEPDKFADTNITFSFLSGKENFSKTFII